MIYSFKNQHCKNGFTLIEMMVSVAIFGVIASILFPALIQFLDARDRIDMKNEQLIGIQKTFLFLAQDIRFASNRLNKNEFGELGNTTLSINNDSLIELTAFYSDLNLNGETIPRRIRWMFDDGVLQRLQYPVMDPDADTRIIRQKLLTDVESVEVQLREIVDQREEVLTTWDSQSRLPDLMEVVIEMQSGIKYIRVFTIPGGDNVNAAAAAAQVTPNNSSGDSSETGRDQIN